MNDNSRENQYLSPCEPKWENRIQSDDVLREGYKKAPRDMQVVSKMMSENILEQVRDDLRKQFGSQKK